ncbi:type II toxin-antitoxin system RelE/ParE family toxin [uncultured Hymenobacter sp.]|uniref:type II toxin-antitoxin system RelE/ParE family toxin n=1 Tax=uncultured Hymenobacter sp. TaxID=170016 RepID=UPI0035CC9C7D
MRVHWSNKALTQLADIADYLRQYSASAADKLEDDLIVASQRLADYPKLGRIVPEGSFEQVRELLVGSHRLVYVAADFGVEIIAVLHQAQRR